MINSVAIENFKNLRRIQIDLDRFTVFVGPNASGKTSVLQAVDLAIRAAIKQEPREIFVDDLHCDWLYTRDARGDLRISCGTDRGGVTVVATPRDAPHSSANSIGHGNWDFGVTPTLPSDRWDALEPADSCTFLRLSAAQLSKPSYTDRVPPKVEADGQGLASVLAYMALNDPDEFERLVERLRELIPHLKRIRFKKVPIRRQEKELVRFGDDTVERTSIRPYQGEAMLFDFEHAANVAAHTVSEGTLLMLGLLTVLLGPARPQLLLLDDIEQGLHPLSQKRLVAVLGEIMQAFPSLQILATSHSPYLLDFLQPDQVRLLSLDASGHAICGRLADHPSSKSGKTKWPRAKCGVCSARSGLLREAVQSEQPICRRLRSPSRFHHRDRTRRSRVGRGSRLVR
jgi:energy-coupling factor transporter ATP-binding protein EcfA2